MNKIFYILEGNNGATYIFNTKNIDSVSSSVKFYKARTIKQKVMKNTLRLYLIIIGFISSVFHFSTLKDKKEIEQYLSQLRDLAIDFELDEQLYPQNAPNSIYFP